jgi:hypothetical protein
MTAREPLDDDERRLQDALGAPPAPRRTDAAFARAVRSDVEARRRRGLLLPVALSGAVATAAVIVAVMLPSLPPGAAPGVLLDGTLAALDEEDDLALDDAALVAVASADYTDLVESADDDEAVGTDIDVDDVDENDDEYVDESDALLAWPTVDADDDEALLALSAALDDALASKNL